MESIIGSVYSEDIKNVVNIMADDIVIACVFKAIYFQSPKKGLLLIESFFQIHGTYRSREEQCA